MRITIIGASGHGRVVADIAKLNGYDEILFLDDNENITECGGYPVVGSSNNAPIGELFIAIGNAEIRRRLMNQYKDRVFPVLIHPSAVLAKDVEIGDGSVVMAGTVINPGVRIGTGSIVNTSSSIDHDCIVGEFVHVSVGAHLCGAVRVGNGTWIGAGVTISNDVSICEGCVIGAGAVIINDIEDKGTYTGVPAKKRMHHLADHLESQSNG